MSIKQTNKTRQDGKWAVGIGQAIKTKTVYKRQRQDYHLLKIS
jgi:hypothetical protein